MESSVYEPDPKRAISALCLNTCNTKHLSHHQAPTCTHPHQPDQSRPQTNQTDLYPHHKSPSSGILIGRRQLLPITGNPLHQTFINLLIGRSGILVISVDLSARVSARRYLFLNTHSININAHIHFEQNFKALRVTFNLHVY